MTACSGAAWRVGASRARAVTTTPGSGLPSGLCTWMTRFAPRAGAMASQAATASRPPARRWLRVRAGGLIPALRFSRCARWRSYDECQHIRAVFMRSFRKRLLVLLIGLVIVTQTVTLAAVLVSTRRTVEARSAEQ